MEIDSPFDRIQATDLFNWTGDAAHPGFCNLLNRIEELLPPPITRAKRLQRFLVRNVWTISAVLFATVAVALLYRLSTDLNVQIAKQAEIATEIQRTLQPIEGMEVTAFVDVDPEIDGVQEYVKHLREQILVSANGGSAARTDLPSGVHPSRTSNNGAVEELSIEPESPLWPSKNDGSWLYYVLSYVDLSLALRRLDDPAGQTALTRPANPKSSQDPDLTFEIGSDDPDGSSTAPERRSIQWDLSSNRLSVEFTDVPIKRYWKFDKQIVSVPDLENSTLRVCFLSVMYPSTDTKAYAAVIKSRQRLALSTILLSYSGRQLMIHATDMAETTDDKGLHCYSVNLTNPNVQHLNANLF
jgi:hypothetical protein